MESCKHVLKITSAMLDTSIFNPQRWICSECGTTDSVYACVTCFNVACGRYIEAHAVEHFEKTGVSPQSVHPIALEVNEGYAFCYQCNDYILNDSVTGDLRLLRDIISVISRQKFTQRGGQRKDLRALEGSGLRTEDLQHIVIKFRRVNLLSKVFSAWRNYVSSQKQIQEGPQQLERVSSWPRHSESEETEVVLPVQESLQLPPGVTGLRNLGNTCYMNSVLQVLSNLDDFRDRFLAFCPVTPVLGSQELSHGKEYYRQSTMECLKRVSTPRKRDLASFETDASSDVAVEDRGSSLSEEVHALLRVMWSGKLSLVIPHGFLHAVWNAVPSFKGYQQQDAQEFLCEMLDKLADEEQERGVRDGSEPEMKRRRLSSSETSEAIRDLIHSLFDGRLESEVTCMRCKHKSVTVEPFSDLSLEFPETFHNTKLTSLNLADESCLLSEMLESFTTVEDLGEVYQCENCNRRQDDISEEEEEEEREGKTRKLRSARKSETKQPQKTRAQKRILIEKLPKILRLHLKRFRWSGRNQRNKINVHVKFEESVNLSKFCVPRARNFGAYRLCGVIMHHGRGFNSGHYTSYCWNSKGKFWMHCNDARLELCSVEDVLGTQAYILFYSKTSTEDLMLSPGKSEEMRPPESPTKRTTRSQKL